MSATGGATGNAVTFTSLTTTTCTIAGAKVTGVAAGTCTIVANQAGNANYAAATQATQNITIGQRPDPTKDANVIGLINLQNEIAKRFSRTQISNFQQRMESLHHARRSGDAGAGSFAQKPGMMAMTNESESSAPDTSSNNARVTRTAQLNDPLQASVTNNKLGSGSPVLASMLVSAATSSSININLFTLTDSGNSAQTEGGGMQVWGAGNVRVGTKNQQAGVASIDYSTDGVSFGVDHRFSDKLSVGMGAGFAHDKSTIGSDGSGSNSDGNSVAIYTSYQATQTMFVDGLLGYGDLSLDSTRYVSLVNASAHANRTGSQVFGSLASGYEYRDTDSLLSPYARYDFAIDRLSAVNETGAGVYSLNYADQTTKSRQISLGLRSEYQRKTGFGSMQPRVRAEYQHHIDGGGQATIAYADTLNTQYTMATPTANVDSLMLGAGSGFVLHSGLNLDLDYQWVHSSGKERSQAIFFRLSKALGGK